MIGRASAVVGVVVLMTLTSLPSAWSSENEAQLGQTSGQTFADAQDLETTTPIKHLITLMQENHSFDNYFGTYPGADGFPEGLCVPLDLDSDEDDCLEPFWVGNDPIIDLAHTDRIFEDQFNDGKMDGFIAAHEDAVGPQAMGYYDDRDLPFYWNVADNYVLFDRFFTSAKGGSVRNHFYWVTGHPGNEEADKLRPEGFDDVPTIFDRLHESGVSWKFYVQNYKPEITFRADLEGSQAAQIVWVPILNYHRFLDDPELNERIVPLEEFFTDLAEGTLPAVSYVVPSGASEHPPGSIQAGERFIRSLLVELWRSDAWPSAAFHWTYDDWGGWYDHVPPPQVDEFGYGFRAPALLVSAYAKRGYVDSTELDFTSVLKFIEENWGVEPLAERDANANNFLSAFDFESPPREPVFLDRVREPIVPKAPRQAVVYASYGGAVALAAALIVAGVIASRLGERRARSAQP